MFPKRIACDGHACSQAVLISPSRTDRSCFSDSIFAELMRCTQYVHFSITPRLRTVTSGFFCILSVSGPSSGLYSKKLNRRTLYGQLFEQYRVPMQRLYVISFRPSSLCVVAATGHTSSHGAVSQCMHGSG